MENRNEVKEESDISTCRLCEKLVLRRYVGKYPNGKDKMYADEDGKLWNGRTCPVCVKDKSKHNMKRFRSNGKRDTDV